MSGPLKSPDAQSPETPRTPTPPTEGLRLVGGLFAGRARATVRAAVRAGALQPISDQDLFSSTSLPVLASLSVWLFLLGGIAFAAIDVIALRIQPGAAIFAGLPFVLWLLLIAGVNIVAYLFMVPIHEGVHAIVILLEGGSPRFGLKLPYAAYCTAPGQVFPRRAYQLVALAPLVVLTAAGLVLTWLFPASGLVLWLFWVGNFSGAAGDIMVAREMGQLPSSVLIADTATGYTAYLADVSAPSKR